MRTSPIIALVAPTEVQGSFSASARTRTRTPRHRGLTVVGFALQLLLHAAAPQPPRALCPPAARPPGRGRGSEGEGAWSCAGGVLRCGRQQSSRSLAPASALGYDAGGRNSAASSSDPGPDCKALLRLP